MEKIDALGEEYQLDQAEMSDQQALSDGSEQLAHADSVQAHTPSRDWGRFRVPMAVLTVLMVGVLLAIQYMPRVAAKPGEGTLKRVPAQMGEWHLIQEYEMSADAANELKPDEYIARIYVNSNGEEADFTILAGSHTGAFHNPQVCFRVQNWEFADNREVELKVPGLKEPIYARIVHLINLRDPKREAVGIYFYSTPLGYRPDTSSARILLLLARVAGMHQRAYFVRFLKPVTGDYERNAETLKQFAEQTLTAMRKTNPEVVH